MHRSFWTIKKEIIRMAFKIFLKIFLPVAALTAFAFLIVHFNSGASVYRRYSSAPGASVNYEKARVTEIKKESLEKDGASGLYLGYQLIRVVMLTGEHKGDTLLVRNTLSYSNNVRTWPGLHVIAVVDAADKLHYNVWIYNYDRGPYLYLIILLFIAVLCIVGGRRGIRSVGGIVFTMAGIVFLFIPMLYKGYSPTLAAIGVVAITACATLALLGGISAKTVSALIGTLAGMIISAIFLLAALGITHLSGYNTGEADALIQLAGAVHMKVGELLFAAIFISSLGAVIDVAISISSAVQEIYAHNPSLRVKNLFVSGMNVGRDMMGAMANTLIIAFTGTELNMLILLRTMDIQYYQLLNTNMIGIYIIQAISGSIAIVLTVPLVALISAQLTPVLMKKKTVH
jgi:uncharacterized membrane protein